MWATALCAIVPLVSALYENGLVVAPCDSPIYCYGDILREIELARPFSDSKTFVDLYVIGTQSSSTIAHCPPAQPPGRLLKLLTRSTSLSDQYRTTAL